MNGYRHRARVVGSIAALLTAATVLVTGPAAGADVPNQVVAWNQHAYREFFVVKSPPLPPPVSIFNFAIMHAAVYDAVNAIDGGHEPYLDTPAVAALADPSDSKDAAAAKAAQVTLLALVPEAATAINGYYADSVADLLAAGESQASIDGGAAVGEAAAVAILAARAGDGRTLAPVPFPFDPTPEPGDWVPLAAGPAGNNFGWVGHVTPPFFIEDADDFATAGPLDLGSAEYAAEFNQVKSVGRATGSTRTPDQTEMALFWADNPPAMWNRIFLQLAENQGLSTVESARYYAMLWMTQGDALIACFKDKERHDFWRPTTAIRMAATDGNPATAPDPEWTSLIPVPPYSDHPSGHNCASSSIVRTLRDFYGTNVMSFSATRTFPPGGPAPITRHYGRFSQAITEIRVARVYSGLHFLTADAQGAVLGRKVANYREDHFFQPA
jgi:hypothetical protein